MNREQIIRMAREAGFHDAEADIHEERLERFAALVAAAERERIIEKNRPVIEQVNAHIKELEAAVAAEREACAKLMESQWDWVSKNAAAAAIRARGNA